MMYCKKCKKEYPDHVKFCAVCGSTLTQKEEKVKKKVSMIWVLLGSVVLFVVALFLCLVLIVGNGYTFGEKLEDFIGTISGTEEEYYHHRDDDDDEKDRDDEDDEDDEVEEDEDDEDRQSKKGTNTEKTVRPQIEKEEVIAQELPELKDQLDSDFVLPNSSTTYLTMADLYGLTADQCRIARNEIYARHGRMFNDAGLQSYFSAFSWYTPTIPADSFQESMLNAYEIANRDLIVQYETEQGFR